MGIYYSQVCLARIQSLFYVLEYDLDSNIRSNIQPALPLFILFYLFLILFGFVCLIFYFFNLVPPL